jgi:adenine-specific DNA-methyltransferase
MIKSIVSASSNENDLVLDCFCGSGTTLQAAQQLGRRWIGIDQSKEAIKVTQKRLSEMENDLFSVNAGYQFLQSKSI